MSNMLGERIRREKMGRREHNKENMRRGKMRRKRK